MAKMGTPYLFLPEVIRREVLPGHPGAYVLGSDQNGFTIGYVGRSDTCLQARLLSHNHLYEFDYFMCTYAPNAKVAFRLECQFWHNAGFEAELANRIHPAAPHGSGLICPYCQFAHGMMHLLGPAARTA